MFFESRGSVSALTITIVPISVIVVVGILALLFYKKIVKDITKSTLKLILMSQGDEYLMNESGWYFVKIILTRL